MKYRLRAPVIGRLFVRPGENPVVTRDDLVLELHVDDTRRVREVSVTATVPLELVKKFESQIVKVPGQLTEVKIGGDRNLHRRLIEELQMFEAGYAFEVGEDHPLYRVRWDLWNEEFIPETDEEREKLIVRGFGAMRKQQPGRHIVDIRHLQRFFAHVRRYDALLIPFSFHREAMNDFQEEQYVQAFVNFYYVIEDFFADGKSSAKEVFKAFRASDLLTEIMTETLKQFSGTHRHDQALQAFLQDEKLDYSVEGLMQLLIRMRGNLHHYYSKSPKPHGTPLNQADFEWLALIALHISGLAILRRVVEINRKEEPVPPEEYREWYRAYFGREPPE